MSFFFFCAGRAIRLTARVFCFVHRRPLAASWTGTLSATYQRAYTHDDLKQTCLHDAYNSPLTHSGLAHDTTFNVLSRFVYEGRGKDEALLVLTAEQAVPVRILFLL